ncbi:MAG: hypothetical protein AAF741_11155 [Bacteroidota bacterium]
MKPDFDKLWDELGDEQKAGPTEQFMKRLQEKALAHAETRVKFNRQVLLGIALFVLLIIGINLYVMNRAPESENQTEPTNEYVPVKSLYDEEN